MSKQKDTGSSFSVGSPSCSLSVPNWLICRSGRCILTAGLDILPCILPKADAIDFNQLADSSIWVRRRVPQAAIGKARPNVLPIIAPDSLTKHLQKSSSNESRGPRRIPFELSLIGCGVTKPGLNTSSYAAGLMPAFFGNTS